MRAFFTCLITVGILVSGSLAAQTMFAPPGAEWYHTIDDSLGVFHSYYTNDSVLSGISCRRVVRIAIVGPPWNAEDLHIDDLPPLYIYNNDDTVFVYNYIFSRFTPLYVFNVHDGDTISLPILPPEMNTFPSAPSLYPDSTFSFVVDSVRMVMYDTATLKTVYTHPLGNCDSDYVYSYGNYNYSTNIDIGIYAERIGGISIGLSPQYRCGANDLDGAYQTQGALRCYNDPTLAIKLVTDSCGVFPTTAITAINKQRVINTYPNPVNDVLHLSITGENTPCFYNLTDMYGRMVSSGNAENNTPVNVNQFPAGVYVLQVKNSEGRLYYQKIVKE